MKELRIPVRSEQFVDLSEIISGFKGIVVGYKGAQATGYIQYDDTDGAWYFMSDINADSNISTAEILLDLINSLLKQGICTRFMVIEFAY